MDLLENYNEDDLPGNAGEDRNGTEDASMQDASEETQRRDKAPGEPDAAGGDPEDRKRIRAWICQWVRQRASWHRSASCGLRQKPRPSRTARSPADPSTA
eukprot:2088199-Amphidinium_carterae.1